VPIRSFLACRIAEHKGPVEGWSGLAIIVFGQVNRRGDGSPRSANQPFDRSDSSAVAGIAPSRIRGHFELVNPAQDRRP